MHSCPVLAVDEHINGASGLILLPGHFFIDSNRTVAGGCVTAAVAGILIARIGFIRCALVAFDTGFGSSPVTGGVFGCFEPVLASPVIAA